jgi:methionyl-tRNA formyltransferase
MGTPEFAVPSLDALLQAKHQVVAVVSQPDRPRGRGRVMTPSPVKEVALRHGIPVYQPEKVREPEFIETLRALEPEIIVVVAFGQFLPVSILEIPKYGCINIHASLLPKYRGAAPIQYSIIQGESTTGVTIQLMEKGMDTGPILLQATTPIDPGDNAGSLAVRLSQMGSSLLLETLVGLEAGTLTPIPQDHSAATYAPSLNREDGQIDWNWDALKIDHRIRGCNPRPGAYTFRNGSVLKLWMSGALDVSTSGLEPGTVVEVAEDSLIVQTGDGMVRLTQVQPEARTRMTGAEFARGHGIRPGDRLGTD